MRIRADNMKKFGKLKKERAKSSHTILVQAMQALDEAKEIREEVLANAVKDIEDVPFREE